MNSRFAAQISVGIIAAHLKGRAFYASFRVTVLVEKVNFETPFFAKPQIHALQHLSPVLRVQSACPRVYGDNRVMVIICFAKEGRYSHPLTLFPQITKLLFQVALDRFIPLLLGKHGHLLEVAHLRFQFLPQIDLIFQATQFFRQTLGDFLVIPEAGCGHLVFEF